MELYSRSGAGSELTLGGAVSTCGEPRRHGAAASTAFTIRLSETGYAVPSAWAK